MKCGSPEVTYNTFPITLWPDNDPASGKIAKKYNSPLSHEREKNPTKKSINYLYHTQGAN